MADKGQKDRVEIKKNDQGTVGYKFPDFKNQEFSAKVIYYMAVAASRFDWSIYGLPGLWWARAIKFCKDDRVSGFSARAWVVSVLISLLCWRIGEEIRKRQPSVIFQDDKVPRADRFEGVLMMVYECTRLSWNASVDQSVA